MPQSTAPKPSPYIPETSPRTEAIQRCLQALEAFTCPPHQRTRLAIQHLRDNGWAQVQWGVGFGWKLGDWGVMDEQTALREQAKIDLAAAKSQ